jgi:hypothetical protein
VELGVGATRETAVATAMADAAESVYAMVSSNVNFQRRHLQPSDQTCASLQE